MNPRFNNPALTYDEEQIVMRVHDAIMDYYGHTGGYCGLGALMIVTLLNMAGGDDYEVMTAPGHWWARNRHTGAHLDPTVDQFNGSRVNYTEQTPPLPGEEYAHAVLYPLASPEGIGRVSSVYESNWNEWAKDWVNNFVGGWNRKDAA